MSNQVGSEPSPKAFVDSLLTATAEMMRILKPTGSIFVNLGDKYAGNMSYRQGLSSSALSPSSAKRGLHSMDRDFSGFKAKSLIGIPWRYAIRCIDELGLILRAEIIWDKPNGLPEPMTDRVRRSHEHWFHFVKQPRYFGCVDEIREPHLRKANGAVFGGINAGVELNKQGSNRVGTNTYDALNPLGKTPGSVWNIAGDPFRIPDWARDKYQLTDHFAAFPQEFPRRLILGWAPLEVCNVCGDGLAAVIEKTAHGKPMDGPKIQQLLATGEKTTPFSGSNVEHRIVGHACSCMVEHGTQLTSPGVVVDPFGGTGTTAMVAKALGRVGVSVDLSLDYCRLATWRTGVGSGAKAMSRTWHERQMTFGMDERIETMMEDIAGGIDL
jgi:DNA modification methylase